LEQKPEEPSYSEGLGLALSDSGRYAEAAQVLERALQIDKQNPYTYFLLGSFYVHKVRQPEKAIPYLEALVTLDPDFPNGYLNLGGTYGLLGRYEQALKAFERELMVRPQSPLALFNLGRVYALMGEKSKARQALQKALDIDPSMEVARQQLDRL
jgi:superkiller protein 3